MNLKLTRQGLQKLLADALAAVVAGNYNGLLTTTPHLALFKTDPGFSLGRVLADYTEADYTGYARLPLTFNPAGESPTGRPQSLASSVTFSPTGSAIGNVVLGALLVTALAGGELRGVINFPVPVELNGTEDDLAIIVAFQMPVSPAEWGIGASVP